MSPAAVATVSLTAGDDPRPPGAWVRVCRLDQLRVDQGAAALVHGEQVAVFRLGPEDVVAIANRDPFSGANVLSRGIVGSRADAVFVASPMHKQPFDLRTGQCLDDPSVAVRTFDVCLLDGAVHVRASGPEQGSA